MLQAEVASLRGLALAVGARARHHALVIVVHHLEHSRSQRILWLLEELGLEYDLEIYQRNPTTKLAPPELKRVHPLGRSPVIVDGEVTMAESGAILEYLVSTYDSKKELRPEEGTAAHREYLYWMHFAEGTAMPPMVMRLVFTRLSKKPVPLPVRPFGKIFEKAVEKQFYGPRIRAVLDLMEDALKEKDWFAGDRFSAADVQVSFPLDGASSRGLLGTRPRLAEFLERIHARPAYRRALERGGAYELGAF